MVASEDKDGGIVVKACTCLTSLLSQFESWSVGIVPFVCFNVIVFTTTQLLLLKWLIAPKGVNQTFVVNCREKWLFYWHGASNFELAIGIQEIILSCIVASKQIPTVLFVNVYHSKEWAEIWSVFPSHPPSERISFNFNLLLRIVVSVLHHLLLFSRRN